MVFFFTNLQIFNYKHILPGDWVQMNSAKPLPINCVVAGLEVSENYKGPLYIGRKQIENELVIGKVIDAWKSGYCE